LTNPKKPLDKKQRSAIVVSTAPADWNPIVTHSKNLWAK
jgi:hypothetical protein